MTPREKQLQNLKCKDGERYTFTKEDQSKGGRNKSRNTLAAYLKIWAEKEVSEKDKTTLASLGITEEQTNQALMLVPIIKNIAKGDIKTIQLALSLLDQNKKELLELEKLRQEIEKLEIEKEQLKQEIALNNKLEERISIVMDVPPTTAVGADTVETGTGDTE